jgi:hypothetical protein
MGRQIIKQPDGKYAVWSSVVDDFVMLDATAEELAADAGDKAKQAAERETREIIRQLDEGQKPYHQFTMSWEEAQGWRREVHEPDSD